MASSDQAVVPHDTSLSSQPGEGLVTHVATSMRQPRFYHHSLSTKHVNELTVHMDSMLIWTQCAHGLDVQISTNMNGNQAERQAYQLCEPWLPSSSPALSGGPS